MSSNHWVVGSIPSLSVDLSRQHSLIRSVAHTLTIALQDLIWSNMLFLFFVFSIVIHIVVVIDDADIGVVYW